MRRQLAAREVRSALHAALASLTEEDRRILGMRYRNREGVTVRQIATTLHLEAQLLYRRIERCLRQLRARMEAQSVSPEAIRTVFGRGEPPDRQEASPAKKTAPF